MEEQIIELANQIVEIESKFDKQLNELVRDIEKTFNNVVSCMEALEKTRTQSEAVCAHMRQRLETLRKEYDELEQELDKELTEEERGDVASEQDELFHDILLIEDLLSLQA